MFKERVETKLTVKSSDTFAPMVYIDPNALDKMAAYVELCSDEIGWLGTVELKEHNIYHITDVFLFDQEVHATTTEITPEGLSSFATDLLAQEDGLEIWNNMRLWGHSHVNMGVSPSGQDHSQMNAFAEGGHAWFMRLIANKKGEIKIDIYNYDLGVEYHDVAWKRIPFTEEIELQEQIAELQKKVQELYEGNKATIKLQVEPEMALKVRKKSYQYYKPLNVVKKGNVTHIGSNTKITEDYFYNDQDVYREFGHMELLELSELSQGEAHGYLQMLGYRDITFADALRVHRVAKENAKETNQYTQQGGIWDGYDY